MLVPLPALMSAPMSVSRAVTTPRRHDNLLEALQRVEAVDFPLIFGDFRIGGVEPRPAEP